MIQFSDAAVLEDSKETTRRRKIDPTTCERDYSSKEMEFMEKLINIKEI